jgi:hypothetical protein
MTGILAVIGDLGRIALLEYLLSLMCRSFVGEVE